jgi:hypothetical protein
MRARKIASDMQIRWRTQSGALWNRYLLLKMSVPFAARENSTMWLQKERPWVVTRASPYVISASISAFTIQAGK